VRPRCRTRAVKGLPLRPPDVGGVQPGSREAVARICYADVHVSAGPTEGDRLELFLAVLLPYNVRDDRHRRLERVLGHARGAAVEDPLTADLPRRRRLDVLHLSSVEQVFEFVRTAQAMPAAYTLSTAGLRQITPISFGLGGLYEVNEVLVPVVAVLLVYGLTFLGKFWQDREQRRGEQFTAEAAIKELLEDKRWAKRSFAAIQQRAGGLTDDELRQLLVRAGAERFQSQAGEELWGLRERNKDLERESNTMTTTEPTPEPIGQPTDPDPFSTNYAPQPQPISPDPEKPPPVQVNALASLALNLALLGTAIFAVIVGHKAMKELKEWETRWPTQKGRTQAVIALILGYIQTILYAVFLATLIAAAFNSGRDSTSSISELHSECANGDMYSCDQLYAESEPGSAEARFGYTCGGRRPVTNTWCTDQGAADFGSQ
jgi:hypothetical protein